MAADIFSSSGKITVQFILIAFLSWAPQSADAQDNWRPWDRMCAGMTEGHPQSEYLGCLNWTVIAPASFGVAGFAGKPLGMQVSDIPFDQWLVAYRVTKYRDDPSQCGEARTVPWERITNRNVSGWGITGAYYTFSSC